MSGDPFAGYDRWLEKPYEAAEVCGACGRDMENDHDGDEAEACATVGEDDGDRAYDAWKDARYEREGRYA